MATDSQPAGQIGHQLMLDVSAEFLGFILIKSINRFTGTLIHVAAHPGISRSVGKQAIKIGDAFLVTLRINIL
ncbi:hypothetical protein AK51_10795 [Serratia nematodiphila DZ0503SBS1]|nr:hypothetical protein AK51_10795 [Serratia nematodiphila DZ0503SBS1]